MRDVEPILVLGRLESLQAKQYTCIFLRTTSAVSRDKIPLWSLHHYWFVTGTSRAERS